jgi:hypothetical protein
LPRSLRDDQMEAFVEQHSVHGAIHALVEVCHKRAAVFDDDRGRRSENLREIARRLTYVEELASRLDL